MLWIGLAIVAVISLLIGGEIISKQKAEQKQQDNIQTALKLVLDDINNEDNSLNPEQTLLMPRTTENVDASVFSKKDSDSNVYMVKITRPFESDDNDSDDVGHLKSIKNVKFDKLSSYWSVDLSSDKPRTDLVTVEDDEGQEMLGKSLYEVKNYKEDQSPKATIENIYNYK
jgi:hypothetical protein